MSCSIVITNSSISGSSIIVSGTSEGCKQVVVKVLCNGTVYSSEEVWVIWSNGIGTWSSLLPICPCGESFSIEVSCKATQNGCLTQTKVLPIIPCKSTSCCPSLTYKTTFGPCTSDNKREVTFDYTITLPSGCADAGPYQGELIFVGTNIAPTPINHSGSSSLTGSIVMTLPIGTSQIVNLIQTGQNPTICDPVSISFTVPNCEDCCPIAVTVISSEVAEKCNPDDITKTVNVSAIVTPTPKQNCPTDVQAVLLVDGVMVATGSSSSPFNLTHSGDYGCGNHIVTVSYPSSTCPDDGSEFCVSVCESRKCWIKRNFLGTAATVGIIALLLYVCNYFLLAYSGPNIPVLTTVTTPLLILGIVGIVFWVINFLSWKSAGCRVNCKKCLFLLNSWQIALASFMGFIILGKSSFIELYAWLISIVVQPWIAALIIILLLLIWIIIIILLYISWVAKCCPTKCEKWTLILETFIFCGAAFGIVIGVIAMANSSAPALFWLSTIATSVWGLILFLIKYKQKITCI
jgi:hypothetical protein